MSVGDLLVGSRLHHVGLVVADLDSAITNYQALGFGAEDRFDVPEQGIQAAFFPLAQGAVELIQPTDPDGAIGRFMAKRGEGFHHVAYAVDDLDASLKQLAKAGIELIDHAPRVGGHGLLIAFVHPRACNGVLTELVQDEGRAGRRGHIERCMERLEPGVGSSGGMLLAFTGSSSRREAGGSQMGGKAGDEVRIPPGHRFLSQRGSRTLRGRCCQHAVPEAAFTPNLLSRRGSGVLVLRVARPGTPKPEKPRLVPSQRTRECGVGDDREEHRDRFGHRDQADLSRR